jgi:hypothetical protein
VGVGGLYVDINDWVWEPRPSIDDAEAAVLAVASGEWDEAATAVWLHTHLRPADEVRNTESVIPP